MWKHTTQGLTLLDTFAVPLFPCPDAAHAETVGAAHAVLMAARHFPQHRSSRILIKGDNRPIIDFMNSVGKLRRLDLQKLLTEVQHALAFSLPPIIWSYTPREFNKCADFLAGIARDYVKQSLTSDQLGYVLVRSRKARTRREPWLGPLWSHRRQPMARSLWICLRRPAPRLQLRLPGLLFSIPVALLSFSICFSTSPFPFSPLLASYSTFTLSSILRIYFSGISGFSDLSISSTST